MSTSQHYIRTIQTSFTASSPAWAASVSASNHHQQYIWSDDIPNAHRLPTPPGLDYPSHHFQGPSGSGFPGVVSGGAAATAAYNTSGPGWSDWRTSNYNRRRSSVPPRMNGNHVYHLSTPGVQHHHQQLPRRQHQFQSYHEELAVHQQRHHQPRYQPSFQDHHRSMYSPQQPPTFTFDPFFDDPLTPGGSGSLSSASVSSLQTSSSASASASPSRINVNIISNKPLQTPPSLVLSSPNHQQKRRTVNTTTTTRPRNNSVSPVISPPPSALPPPSFPSIHRTSSTGIARATADYTHPYTNFTSSPSAMAMAPPPLFPGSGSRLRSARRSPSPPQQPPRQTKQTVSADVAIMNPMPNPIHIQLNATSSRKAGFVAPAKVSTTTTAVTAPAPSRSASPAPIPTKTLKVPAPSPAPSPSPPPVPSQGNALAHSNAEKERQARLRLIAGILLNRVYDVSKKSSSGLRLNRSCTEMGMDGAKKGYVKSGLSRVVCCES